MAENTSGYRAFTNGGTMLVKGTRVKLTSGLLAASGSANGDSIGVLLNDVPANGIGTVKLNTASGTFEMRAGIAISAGANIFPAASGKISNVASGSPLCTFIGVALEAATADGDIIEVALGVTTNS